MKFKTECRFFDREKNEWIRIESYEQWKDLAGKDGMWPNRVSYRVETGEWVTNFTSIEQELKEQVS